MSMARLSNITMDDLNAEQKASLAQLQTILSQNGLGGPFAVWLRMPGIGPKIVDLFVTHRHQGKLEKRLFELMTLVVIRHWSAQFAWWAHSRRSRELGITPEIIESIRHRRAPRITRDDEQLVFDVTTEIMTQQRLGDATYARAKALLGEGVLIELIFAIGFYNMVGITLSAFDVPTPDGSKQLD
jgi:4-carboxymuconolactone decarboxylase